MKALIAIASSLLFLVLVFIAYRALDQSSQTQLVVGWSNSLVWSVLGTPITPRFENTALEPGEAPGQWQVTGEVAYRDGLGIPLKQRYEATVEQVCADHRRRACWHLAALSLDGTPVDPRPPPPKTGTSESTAPEGPEEPAALEQAIPPEAGQNGTPGADPIATDPRPRATVAPDSSALPPLPTEPVALLRAIQEALNAAGYDAGPPDGQMGPRTAAAIAAYQRAAGLVIDGAPSPGLLRHLLTRGS